MSKPKGPLEIIRCHGLYHFGDMEPLSQRSSRNLAKIRESSGIRI